MISTFDVLFLAALPLLAFYLYMTWNFNYWKKRGIPCDDNLSVFFGSLTDAMLGRKPLGLVYTDIYKKFPGKKVVGYFKFRTPALIVRDPEIIRKVLISDFGSFLNNDIYLDPEADPIMGKNIFVLRDELWKKGRALITPAFTLGRLKNIYAPIRDVAKELVSYLKIHPEEIHVKPVMSKYTSEIVAKCAFGIEGNNFKHPNPRMAELGSLIWEPSLARNLKMTSIFIMPAITKLLRIKMVPKKVIDFFNEVLRDVIVYRQEKNVERNDLVQYFIDIKRKTLEVAKGEAQSEILTKVYTDDDVLSGCVTFFVESYETTALTLNNVLYQLALHQDVQDKLRAEVDDVLSEGELTMEKLNSMSYLHSVYAETNRIIPALFTMQKICTERYEMDIGEDKPLVIEKGTPVSIPVYGVQTDPAYWEDAEVFKPERFAGREDEALVKSKGIYMPFSDGPRICPGSRIATTMVKLAVVEILSKLQVLPTSKTPRKMDFEPNYFLVGHKGGIYLKFAERTH